MIAPLLLAAATVLASPPDEQRLPSALPHNADATTGCSTLARSPATDAATNSGPEAPASRATSPLAGLGMELAINNDKPEASLSWGHKSRPCMHTGGPDGATAYFRQTGFTASASVPIGGKDDLTDPQTLDKLSNGAQLTIGISRFGFSGSDAGSAYRPGTGWQIGVDASLGYNKFEYRQPTTLNKASVGKVQYSVGAFGALYPTDQRSMIGASVEYQFAYKALDETILCKPTVVNPADDCVQSAPGTPKPKLDSDVGTGVEHCFVSD